MRRSTLYLLGCGTMLVLLGELLTPALARITQIGLVTDIGKVDDRTFNEFAYQGMMRAVKEFGLKSAFIETQQPTDYEKNIEQLASTGSEMIITVGFMLGDATKKMALKYPHIQFAIVDFAYDPPVANILGLRFAEDMFSIFLILYLS